MKKSIIKMLFYYSEPKIKKKLSSLDEVDPELLRTFEKLGIPLTEQKTTRWSGCRCYF
jgi:Fe-S cluster assembly protein SufB